MRTLIARFLICAPLFLLLSPAHADLSNIRINGFGQVVGGTTFSNDHQAIGYGADPKFDQESLYALQIAAPLTSKMTATAQLLGRGTGDFKPKFEWAYVTYQFNNDWSVKVGRQRIPYFMYSQVLDVGVAYPWLRTPKATYGLPGSLTDVDGIAVNYSHAFGKWQIDPQIMFGRFTGNIPENGAGSTTDYYQLLAFTMHANYDDWLTLHSSFLSWKVSLKGSGLDGLTDPMKQAGLTEAANDVAMNGDTMMFADVGAEINYEQWQIIGEYIQGRFFHMFIHNPHAGYVAVGRHFGKFEPMITYGRTNSATSGQALNEIPDTPDNQGFRQAVGGLISSQKQRDSYYMFNLRYDLARNVALKLDYTVYRSSIAGTASSNLLSAGVAYSF